MTYLRNTWDDASRRRLGVALIVVCATFTVLSFLEVGRQAWNGNSDRTARAYFRWLKLFELKLRHPEEGRRWTLAEIRGIEEKLNINARPPRRPPTEQEVERRRKEDEWKADDAVAVAIENYEARATIG
eukprot:Gregarina_sp_Poly_1__6685@NODE_35_length_18769_cov_73_980644_g30_i0_p18_GENE_NODE_35_length_18769_cov_73_980644_g30_i0NODE_35_length_18769_cov_73_980644_g30_i0_p18_ORF_typecomplete_len129_score23_70_NODE_35_length_18769_cov_73_980644_g30_i022342620